MSVFAQVTPTCRKWPFCVALEPVPQSFQVTFRQKYTGKITNLFFKKSCPWTHFTYHSFKINLPNSNTYVCIYVTVFENILNVLPYCHRFSQISAICIDWSKNAKFVSGHQRNRLKISIMLNTLFKGQRDAMYTYRLLM
jgi:hypothetical protein